MKRALHRRSPRRRWVWPRTAVILGILAVFGLWGFNRWGHSRQPRTIGTPNLLKTRRRASIPSHPPRKVSQDPTPAVPSSTVIPVAAQSQFPQLPNGCEVTSLSMLLSAVGHPMSKMTLAAEMPKDPTPLQLADVTTATGQIVHKVVYWGNPNVGFVGSVYRANYGYGISNGPMMTLLNQVLPGRAENLTGRPFSDILARVAHGIPVEVWTTLTFQPTTDWVTWNSPEGLVHATPLEHAVLVVGYRPHVLLINNPWTGQAAEAVAQAPFVAAWKQLGKQAITTKPSR